MTAEIKCLHDEVWEVARFVEHPKNPNRHPISQIALLAKVIVGNGWRNALVVSKQSGFLIRGHGRLAAAKHAGLETCPVQIQSYESQEAELADMLADNRLAELSVADSQAIIGLVNELLDAGSEFPTGYTEVDIQNMILSMPDDENTPQSGKFRGDDVAITTTGTILKLVIRGKRYPLGPDESVALELHAQNYFKETGTLLGFVARLVENSK